MASAVLSGASYFEITRGVDRICVEFDGHFQPRELQHLLADGMQHRRDRMGHLTFALTAALASQPELLILESQDQCLRIEGGQSRLDSFACGAEARIRFALVKPLSKLLQWDVPETALVRERVADRLLKIQVNNEGAPGYFLGPNGWPRRRQSVNPLPPPGWTCQVTEGPPWQITFQSGSEAWKDPDQLKAVLQCVLHSRLQSQSEEVLPCPNCAQPMQKQMLDVVLDRCNACHGLWFDYAEFEWLMKKDPNRGLLAAPAGANCPRCRVPLRESSRAHKPAAECPQCRGTWFLLRPPPAFFP